MKCEKCGFDHADLFAGDSKVIPAYKIRDLCEENIQLKVELDMAKARIRKRPSRAKDTS